jgi:peptide/nickel transport system permease protein
MQAYILRRLVTLVPTLLLVAVLTFMMMRVLPGDPIVAMLGGERGVDQATYQQLRAQYGLDRPLAAQFASWLLATVHGDFGQSFRSRTPVMDAILTRLPVTVELGGLAFLISLIVGLPLGILAALRPNRLLDSVGSIVALGGVAFPSFWLGILLVAVFSLTLHWVPPSGFTPAAQDLGMNLRLLALPGVTLAVGPAAVLLRQVRSEMIEVLANDYVRTAWAKGLPSRIVVTRHALQNALIPIVTLLGLQVGRVVGGAVIVETIFAVPGLGLLLMDGITYRDYPAVQGIVLMLAVVVVLSNLLADVLYGYLDPRIRYS